MSNRVTLQSTTFQNHPSKEETHGYRMYDDYGQSYNNLLDKKQMEDMSDADLLHEAANSGDDVMDAMIEHAIENGMFINDEWYDGEEVQSMLNGG